MPSSVAPFLLLLFASLVLTQPTPPPVCEGTSCADCLSQAGCGWCAPTQTCRNGDFAGPTDGSLCLSGWFGNLPVGPPSPERCPACSIVPSCLECTHTSGCGWCSETKTCVEVTGNPTPNCTPVDYCHYTQCYQCLAQATCAYCSKTMRCDNAGVNSCGGGPQLKTCACSQLTDCNSCTSQETCAWCSAQRTCQDADLPSSCTQTHTCPPSPGASSFSAGSFVGGMFLTLGVLILAVGVPADQSDISAAYFLWTLYVTRRSRYVEVQ